MQTLQHESWRKKVLFKVPDLKAEGFLHTKPLGLLEIVRRALSLERLHLLG
jgi:hypothetical protein